MLVNKVTIKGLTCPKTNRELAAYQQVTIDELPYVLLLHLKCFEYKQQKLTKIVKNVEFSVDLKIEPSKCSLYYLKHKFHISVFFKSICASSDLFFKFGYINLTLKSSIWVNLYSKA